MGEREEIRVTPQYRLDFINLDLIPNSTVSPRTEQELFDHSKAVPYTDAASGARMLLVINSDDTRLVQDMHQSAKYSDPSLMSEAFIKTSLESYATRLPVAAIWYDDTRSFIKCEEPSCKHYIGGGCTNEKVIIQDDCLASQWCMTYEPEGKND